MVVAAANAGRNVPLERVKLLKSVLLDGAEALVTVTEYLFVWMPSWAVTLL